MDALGNIIEVKERSLRWSLSLGVRRHDLALQLFGLSLKLFQLPLLVGEAIPERRRGFHNIIARAQGRGRRLACAFCGLAHVFGVAPELFGRKPRLLRGKMGGLRVTSDPFSDLSQAFARLSSTLGDLAPLLRNLALLLGDLALLLRNLALLLGELALLLGDVQMPRAA